MSRRNYETCKHYKRKGPCRRKDVCEDAKECPKGKNDEHRS